MFEDGGELGVVVVHGVGEQSKGYSHAFRDRVAKEIRRLGEDPGRLHYEEVWWADVLDGNETAYLEAVMADYKMRYKWLRSKIVTHAGDAVAYQRSYGRNKGAYEFIHERLEEALLRVEKAVGKDTPLVALGHSLGSIILSNYTWDHQKRRRKHPRLSRMDTLLGMVTFGSTMPLFALQRSPPQSIPFPPPTMQAAYPQLAKHAKWLNFFDLDDALGWPLAHTGGTYTDLVADGLLEDHAINVGRWHTSWNPMSHGGYWTDKDFVRPVAGLLADLLDATDKHNGRPPSEA